MLKRFNISLFLIALLLWSSSLFAQAPESMNYQAVIRDGSGDLVASQQVGLRIKILQGSATGSSVYEETYSPTTNAYGLVNLQLGTGTVQSGTFSSIDWGNGPYFVETAADVSGGTSYVTLSTTQFMSVPYALYAKNAGLDSAAVQAMIDAAGSSGGAGAGGKSFAFPEGLHGTPITYAISSGNYTVPTGKRLYILNLQGGTSHTLNVNGFTVNYYATNNTTDKTLGLPIILSAGDVLSGTDAVFNGFLVNSNANLSTVTHRLLGNSNYTVPAGKILYILNVNGGTSHNLYIDGTRVNHYLTNNTSGKTLNLPIIASAGNVITGADGVFNGYVVDENFFDSSSSGSSGASSSSSSNNTQSLVIPEIVIDSAYAPGSNSIKIKGKVLNATSNDFTEIFIRFYNNTTTPISNSVLSLPLKNAEYDNVFTQIGNDLVFDQVIFASKEYCRNVTLDEPQDSTLHSGSNYQFILEFKTINGLSYYSDYVSFSTNSVGQTGPAGGIVFFDKGFYSNGWRYLEAYPDTLTGSLCSSMTYFDSTLIIDKSLYLNSINTPYLGSKGWYVGGIHHYVGIGNLNTNIIHNNCSVSNNPASKCLSLSYGSKSDWFLPSNGEMTLIYFNLMCQNIGGYPFVINNQDEQTYLTSTFWNVSTRPTINGFGRFYMEKTNTYTTIPNRIEIGTNEEFPSSQLPMFIPIRKY